MKTLCICAFSILLLSNLAFGQAVVTTPITVNDNGVPTSGLVTICQVNPGAGQCASLVNTFSDITLGVPCIGTLGPLNGNGCSNPGYTDALGNVIAYTNAGAWWCQYSGITISPYSRPCPSDGISGTGGVASVSGTTNQIVSSGGGTPVLSIPASFIAPGSITATTGITAGTAITDSGLSAGNCVQTTTGGLLATTGAPCSTGVAGVTSIFGSVGAVSALTVPTGGSIAVSGSGTNNATTLLGNTWAAPAAIGGTTPSTGAFTALSASGAVSGTGFSAYLASPPAIGGTAPAAGTFTNVTDSALTSGNCVQAGTAGLLTTTGAACGSGGGGVASVFGATGTITALTVPTGGSIAVSGSGTNNATSIGGITVTGTPSTGYVPTATGSSAATWQPSAAGTAFSAITSSTNTTAAMVLGTGSSLGFSGGTLGGAIYETALANLGTDISGLTSGGSIIIPASATGTIPSGITVSNPNIKIQCQTPFAPLARAAAQSFTMFTIAAAATGFTIQGCTINMNGGTGLAILANSGTSNLTILNNNINGASGGTGAVQMNGTTTGLIQGNVITNGNIFGQNNTSDIRVVDNDVTNLASSAIVFHSTTNGALVQRITIEGNHIHAQGTFCVEVGSFDGAAPLDITVTGNECDMTGAGSGGYSFGAVIGGAIIGNTFNAGLQTSGIAGIELAPSLVNLTSGTQTGNLGGTISGNTLNGGDISLNESSDVTVTTNTVTIGNGLPAVYIGGSAGLSTNNNNLTNNTLICTAACNTGAGGHGIIWMQANNAAESVSNNSIAQNLIVGSGTGNSEAGVYGEDDSGAMTGNQVTGNIFNSMAIGYWFNNAGSASTVLIYGDTCNTVTTCQHAAGTNVTYTPLTCISGPCTSTIYSGTAALGTSAIASGAASSTVTKSAPGVLTTDVVRCGFNGTVVAVTGYAPSANGTLTIVSYPTANNINIYVQNNTANSITPGAVTLNCQVTR